MKDFAKFDEIPSMTPQDIKEKNVPDTPSFGQRENSIPSHKHSLRGYKLTGKNSNPNTQTTYIYTHGKRLGNTSSPNYMFLEFQLPVAWRYQIFDSIRGSFGKYVA